MAWEDIAPILNSVGVTRAQTETYFENVPEQPAQPTPPPITKAKVVAVADRVFDGRHGIEKHGGVAKIAQTVKLTKGDTQRIVDELQKLWRLWLNTQSEVE